MASVLIGLQVVQVLILWLHDWLPAPPLNDVKAVRAADGVGRLVGVTILQSAPYTIGLVGSWRAGTGPWPGWLGPWLWISYGLLFAGELRAWWIPYLAKAEPERAARYRDLFGRTHAFLPERNGITPNTLHTMLHACTAATLAGLMVRAVVRV
jgi:hypothetical protein